MLMYRKNIEFPQGDFVAHQKKKVAKTWEGLERLTFSKDKSMKITTTNGSNIPMRYKITNKDAKVKVKVGDGK